MNSQTNYSDPDDTWPHRWREVSGTPNPAALETVDASIRKVMVEQKREISLRKFPELSSD